MPPSASRKRPKPGLGTAKTGQKNTPAASKGESKTEKHVFTVTEAAIQVKKVVEDAFPPIWILGEVSSCRQPRSGHLYFSLKDGRSLLHSVMFRSAISSGLTVALKDGMEVLVFGRLSTYERGSEVQIIVDRVEAHGQGALELQREALEQKFAQAGLFLTSRKRPLPKYPKRIGIVTSPTGAAIRDILTTLDRQWPFLHVVIAPARVQGEGAAEQIGHAIDALNELQPAPDIIIVSRGGGSVEHLWCFNLEAAVLAVARSRIPVITGVGHEVDETLADLVADLRTATPTAAAKAAVPDFLETSKVLADSRARLQRALKRQLDNARTRLEAIEDRYTLRSIRDRLNQQIRELDVISERLHRSIKRKIKQQQQQLSKNLADRLNRALVSRLKKSQMALAAISKERLHRAMLRRVQSGQLNLAQSAAQLEALSPLGVLARGYSIVLKDGLVVKDSQEVKAGEILDIHLAHGQIRSRVLDNNEKEVTKNDKAEPIKRPRRH